MEYEIRELSRLKIVIESCEDMTQIKTEVSDIKCFLEGVLGIDNEFAKKCTTIKRANAKLACTHISDFLNETDSRNSREFKTEQHERNKQLITDNKEYIINLIDEVIVYLEKLS